MSDTVSESAKQRNLAKTIAALRRSNGMAGSESVRIVAIGDSVTAGWLEHGVLDSDASYPAIFRKRLSSLYPSAMISVVNAGLGGENTEGALARLERDALSFTPHLVTVCLGLNDSRRGREYLPMFADNLKQIVRRVRSGGADAILITPNPRVEGPGEEGVVVDFIRAIRATARAEEVALADVHAIYGGAVRMGASLADLMSNRVSHPTREGHLIFANALIAHFQPG